VSRLAGKRAVVVGAGFRGPGPSNGSAVAITFAREGANVLCVDIDAEAAERTAQAIAAEGGAAQAAQVDATDERQLADCIASYVERRGGLDVLHNNVGITHPGGVTELSEEEWDKVFAVNLKTCFFAMKHAIPAMRRGGAGSIINVSSVASLRYVGDSYATYYSSKAALNHLTRVTAVEHAASQIRVNAILPGLIRTSMVTSFPGRLDAYAGDEEAFWAARARRSPMKRMGEPWDIANAALFLASDESRYVTGLELVVDGGMTLCTWEKQ
jgi:NAD(P)-dependent dehydrogenase (short-subunit alcohol dehydrogenase family)